MTAGVTYCVNEEGELVSVPAEDVAFRPAVYGILIDNQRVLLERHGQRALWRPPGGRLDDWQTPGHLLRARFRAIMGFAPIRGPLLLLEEQFRANGEGQAWHLVVMYYALRRPVGSVAAVGDEGPQWVPLDELAPDEMLFGHRAVEAARNIGWRERTEQPPDDLSSSL